MIIKIIILARYTTTTNIVRYENEKMFTYCKQNAKLNCSF